MFFRKTDYIISFLLILILSLSLIPKHLIYESFFMLTIQSIILSLILGTVTNFIRYLIFKSNERK